MAANIAFTSFPYELAKAVKLLVLDIDGVMTDGGLYYDATGQCMKKFHVQDGLGIRLAHEVGLHIAVITGLTSKAVACRMEDLKITDYYAGFTDKRESLDKIRTRYSLTWNEVAYLGDDWVDLAVMHQVGLPLAVANGQPEVKAIAKYVTSIPGGQGAVREVIHHILIAQDLYQSTLTRWSFPC